MPDNAGSTGPRGPGERERALTSTMRLGFWTIARELSLIRLLDANRRGDNERRSGEIEKSDIACCASRQVGPSTKRSRHLSAVVQGEACSGRQGIFVSLRHGARTPK